MSPTWLAVILLACAGGAADSGHTGSATTGPDQGTYDAEIFVGDAALGWCGAIRDCEPGTWQGAHGGDQQTCLGNERARWASAVDAMSCELDVALAVTCVNSLATTSCEAWEAGTTQARCEAVITCP